VLAQFDRAFSPFLPITEHLPIPATRRFHRARAVFDTTIHTMIADRRSRGIEEDDLLSLLMRAQEAGIPMTDEQVRDEAITIFLAGHETTANALAWTWLLLAQNPELARRFRERVDDPLHVEAVLHESMRLYPPAWAVSRLALEEVAIGDWLVPRGAVAVVVEAVIHRDPRFWPDPDRFDPSRFTAEAKAARPKFAYFPFGAGPRICIGEGFAWMEGVLMLATIAQRWRMELVSRRDVRAQASITLRPQGGIAVRLSKAAV